MQAAIANVYKKLISGQTRDELFTAQLYELMDDVPHSDDKEISTFMNATREELDTIAAMQKSDRHYPELLEFMCTDAAAVTTSFLKCPDGYLEDGFDYVLAHFVAPVTRYCFSLRANVYQQTLIVFPIDNGYFEADGPFGDMSYDICELFDSRLTKFGDMRYALCEFLLRNLRSHRRGPIESLSARRGFAHNFG